MNKDSLGKILSKIVSGLYVVTTKKDEQIRGYGASFLMQVNFEPPMIAIGVNKESAIFELINSAGVFAVNFIAKENLKLFGHFAKPRDDNFDYLENINHEYKELGVPILKDSMGYLECKIKSVTDAGKHSIIIGEVINGDIFKDSEPYIHIRKNGFSY